jgi:hypothetical protein
MAATGDLVECERIREHARLALVRRWYRQGGAFRSSATADPRVVAIGEETGAGAVAVVVNQPVEALDLPGMMTAGEVHARNGGSRGPSVSLSLEEKQRLGVALNEATLLGVELDPERRLAAATLAVLTLPETGPGPRDSRVQLLFSPGRPARRLAPPRSVVARQATPDELRGDLGDPLANAVIQSFEAGKGVGIRARVGVSAIPPSSPW